MSESRGVRRKGKETPRQLGQFGCVKAGGDGARTMAEERDGPTSTASAG